MKHSHLGEAVRVARERRGLYQYQLAQKAYLSRSAMSRLELGQVEPTDEVLCQIARVLNCPEILEERCQQCIVSRELRRLKTVREAA